MIIKLDSLILENLSKTELQIVNFINENEEQLPKLSIVDIAFETFSSPSTVSRAIRKCGVNGFNELRYRSSTKTPDSEIQNLGEIMNKSLVEAQRVIEQISLTNVLNIIKSLKTASRIYVFARGLSSYVGQEFALKLQLLDHNVFFAEDSNIVKIKAQSIKRGELLFMFSINGKTPELIEAAQAANVAGATIVTCCCSDNSELLPLSTYSLVGFKHAHTAIKEFEVSSRIPLYMMSRIIIDYLTTY